MRRGEAARGAGVLGATAIVALAMTACIAAPADSPSAPTSRTDAAIANLDARECDADDGAALGLAAVEGLWCGALTVPADRRVTAGTTIELTVVMTGGDAPRGPLLLIGGGPGGASAWAVPVVRAVMPEIAAEYQLVAMDLRGTGLGALDCPDVQHQVGTSDILAPDVAAIDACAAILGERAETVSTDATVADLDDLRAALGASTWTLDGTSYGTFVAARYAAAHPEAVAGLVLDSVVPVTGVDPFLLTTFDALPEVLTQACRAEQCETDPIADLAAVLESGADPVELLNTLVAYSALAPTFPGVFDALASARAGEPAPLAALVDGMRAATAAPLATFSAATHIATLCADTPMPWDPGTRTASERTPALERAIAGVPAERTAPFPPGVAAQLATTFSCLHWPYPSAGAQDAFAALADVPALLLSGEMDLSTPPANAEHMAQWFAEPRIVTVDGAGHGVQMTPGGVAAMTEFLLAPR